MAALVVVAALGTACGTAPTAGPGTAAGDAGSAEPSPPPPDALGGAAVVRTARLDVDEVSIGAVDREALLGLLADAGFEGAVERWFFGGPELRRIQVRIVAFGDAEGADRYAEWLRTHPEEMIGTVRALEPRSAPAGVSMFVHRAQACCPKETNVVLASWSDGRNVVRVLVAGPAAGARSAGGLVDGILGWSRAAQ